MLPFAPSAVRFVVIVLAALLPLLARGQDSGVVPMGRQANNVAIIPIRGAIDDRGVMAASVARRLKMAERAGAHAVVFEINSPGGSLDGVLRICNAIKATPIGLTVAWINTDAYSGGAIIALACDEILINDPVSFGDAMPISGGPFGVAPSAIPKELLKKIMPPLVSEILDSARRYNRDRGAYVRDEYLLQGLVANDLELWLVRNPATGQRLCIDREEFEMLFPGQSMGGPPRLAGVPGAKREGAEAAVPSTTDVPAGSSKLSGIADEVNNRMTITSERPRLTPADAGKWELVEKVLDGTGPAVFKAADMEYFDLAGNPRESVNGVARLKPVRNDQDLAAYFQARHTIRYDSNWSEGLVLFMTHIAVRALLVLVFLVAMFVEMTHPGAVVPGSIAVLALAGLIAPPMLIGMAGWWTLAAIFLGVGLLALEAFVIPGFGIAGVSGLLLLFMGLVGTFLPMGAGIFPGSPEARSGMLYGSTVVLLMMFTAGVAMYFIAKHFGSLPVLGRLVLKSAAADDDASAGMLMAMDDGQDVRVGATGTAMTPMRPAGRVQIGGRVVDAVAEFGFIAAGTPVKVVNADGVRIGVEAV